ncbi:GTP cyclohydrolase 3 [Natronomonas pharaonis DSM 2160]|uniref:GTP cyclohydrolase III n=1 Tax=Natronomonas pharaonis (strain ATCC 35678 / DSM 2160 / CIP 103997 / JCM 8858 / NBRC 14720 / NCIMB 2260 / Gabara) TaxID=348780 RepID=GCH3_NATPD|nr:GTP cyclohydrolase III [Natronomonas pharaonis]Q3INZ0.1 RecName: Full=GTP cyclohydrolase III [Natronomonas pharaonis DSM 2160]CAI50162.1 GTP cyclohydrolase 3 [Natronomonas pharaonis DSM 2160]
MTNTQVTLVQIDNYGPWTVTPEPRREVDLQTLQSRLYADLSQLIGNRMGYVFFTRFDNMVAVTNGLDADAHALIQESVGNRYPVTVSLSIGVDSSPAAALGTATDQLQDAGSAQDKGRTEILRGDPIQPSERTDTDVQIAHFDVNDATGKYTDQLNEFDSFINIEQGYAELMRYMRHENDSLSFFVGGDNIIAVCDGIDEAAYLDAIEHVNETVGVELKVGVGLDRTAQAAGMAAKHALETCREENTDVEFAR